MVTQPWSSNDVDRDLWAVLDLASDEELEGVHDILFGEQHLQHDAEISTESFTCKLRKAVVWLFETSNNWL